MCKQPAVFSKAVLKILGQDADVKKTWQELDTFVPELMDLCNHHFFDNRMKNKVVRWAHDWKAMTQEKRP